MIITIDGPSGTGKSTLAKQVAERLGFAFFDTGAMYRAFAWWLLREGIEQIDDVAVALPLMRFSFRLETDSRGERHYFVGEQEVTAQIREPHISSFASKVARIPSVRTALVQIQREFGSCRDAVFEGRDMGTVVFPQAEVKIFLTADATIRAERRLQELCTRFPDLAGSLTLEEIRAELLVRDQQDMTREVSPLRKAEGAIEIDTSALTCDQVVERVLKQVQLHLRPARMRPFYRFIYLVARAYFRLFFRLRVYGLTHFPQGGAIIAANHASLFDPPVVAISCPEEVHFLAKASLFSVPILGRLIRALNSHPVVRSGSDAAIFRKILTLIKEGKKVLLFPEGQRGDSEALQPLEQGLAFLVYKSRCKIVPVYVQGTAAAWNRTKRWPKWRGHIRCAFGSAISWEEFAHLEKRAALTAITLRCETALSQLQKWVEEGACGIPP